MDAQVGQVEGHARIRQDAALEMPAVEPLVASSVHLSGKRDIALQM